MTTTVSKKETQLEAALRKNREERKKLNREIAATKRRRIAEERRALEKRNQLLGHALVSLMPHEGLVKFKGRVAAAKDKFLHVVNGQPDDSEFRRILACMDDAIAEKQIAEDSYKDPSD
jgi:ABC-type phosphate transport system auxiliary subunit